MYDLHSLGWHSFQQLCLAITREILGQTVESFLDSTDAGRDGAFSGVWSATNGDSLRGYFVIQCKFTSKRDKNLKPAELADEADKARKLVLSGRCDCYILMTNAGLSGQVAADVEDLFRGVGVKQVRSFGSTWICQQIVERKRLRMLVPRVYGLGDLSQILDERAYKQAKTLLASLREDLSKVVLTGAYRRAADALNRHGFVLLVGEPAAGKTTIASMLSIGALDQWDASTLKLDRPEAVVSHWNPDEPSQFFWIDDAFGVTQYESFLVRGWNHVLPTVKTMLRKGSKVVMTSRDYIYRRARNDLKEGAFPLLRESQVVIDVRDLTLEEKEQILYNHIKLGTQSVTFKKAIKPFLAEIASHPRFIPETARRLGDPFFTKELPISRFDLRSFVERQEDFLQEVLRGVDCDCKAALALIYMRSDAVESPVKLGESEREAIERLGSNLGGCIAGLESMQGSLARLTQMDGTAMWKFKHPTVGDAFAQLLLESPELLGIYVYGSPIDKLLEQVTCGDVGLERAVIVPKALFGLVLKRINDSSSPTQYKSESLAKWVSRSRIDSFLATRCSKEFLLEYIRIHPDVLKRVSSPGLFLHAVSEVDLAIQLHKMKLLPEENRQRFVATVVEYAIQGEDLYAIDNRRIQKLFSSVDLSNFHRRIREQLVPNLTEIRRTWQNNCGSDEDPEEMISPLLDSLEALAKKFADEPTIHRVIKREIRLGNEWIAERTAEEPKKDRPDRNFGDVNPDDQAPLHNRTIFDDVDE